jgi:hypothetical protein
MGPSGSGKSTVSVWLTHRQLRESTVDTFLQFINNALRLSVAACDHGYESCTSKIKGYIVPKGNALYTHLAPGGHQGRVIIIDTPGLDNEKFTEFSVLQGITSCLRDA